MKPIVVAGHICLDLSPTFDVKADLGTPGVLHRVGPLRMSPGGAVANTGIALHRLGAPVRLVGLIGLDLPGTGLSELIGADLGVWLVRRAEVATSYSVVLEPPGQDRSFLHCPGANDAFTAADLPDSALADVAWLHFGYPTLMATMYRNQGEALVAILKRARDRGIPTSLDLGLPDPQSEAGLADWRRILAAALPYVDVFMPSIDELRLALRNPEATVSTLGQQCRDLGASAVIVKRGSAGIWATNGGEAISVPAYPVTVVGATGAGDAAAAGFIHAAVQGLPFADCIRAASIVGALSCTAPNATSAIPNWAAVQSILTDSLV